MGTWATLTDIQAALDDATLKKLSQDSDLAYIASGTVSTLIGFAEGRFLTACRAAHTTPSASSLVAKSTVVALTVVQLYRRKNHALPEEWQREADAADKVLQMIARGEMTLEGDGGRRYQARGVVVYNRDDNNTTNDTYQDVY